MPHDSAESLAALTQAVIRFRNERDWKQFHNAKDVSLSLVLEATELLEVFQWTPEHDAAAKASSHIEEVQDELADILYWVLLLAHDLQIDLAAALHRKLDANALKYPVEKARGSSRKYRDL